MLKAGTDFSLLLLLLLLLIHYIERQQHRPNIEQDRLRLYKGGGERRGSYWSLSIGAQLSRLSPLQSLPHSILYLSFNAMQQQNT